MTRTYVSKGGTRWTATKRRSRANGLAPLAVRRPLRKRLSQLVETLLTSENGATRWVDELDLAEKFTAATED